MLTTTAAPPDVELTSTAETALPPDLPILPEGPLAPPAAGPLAPLKIEQDYKQLLEVPLDSELPANPFFLHVDTRLTVEQSTTLRRITAALDRAGATLKSGERVVKHAQAVRWLLEAIHKPEAPDAPEPRRVDQPAE